VEGILGVVNNDQIAILIAQTVDD